VLRWHHARVAHHLRSLLEATETAKLCRHCDRRHLRNATKRLQGIDNRAKLGRSGVDGAIDSTVETRDALALVVYLQDQLDERRICSLCGSCNARTHCHHPALQAFASSAGRNP